jgi:hypothetical protein
MKADVKDVRFMAEPEKDQAGTRLSASGAF